MYKISIQFYKNQKIKKQNNNIDLPIYFNDFFSLTYGKSQLRPAKILFCQFIQRPFYIFVAPLGRLSDVIVQNHDCLCCIGINYNICLNQKSKSKLLKMNKQTAQRRQQSILRSKNILFAIYIIHSILIAIYSTYILIKYHDVPSLTITFIMILVYGYMIVWVLIVNFLFILCQKQQKAVCFTRIFVKIIFFLFPIFGLLSISKDEQLNKKQIHIFIIYMGVITFLIILYEIITCICYEHKQPEFLFQTNDLKQANDLILQKRNEYNQMIKKQ